MGKQKVRITESINGFDNFLKYLRAKSSTETSIGGYVFPNQEAADRFMNFCKEKGIKY